MYGIGPPGGSEEIEGYSYAALLTRAPREEVLRHLTELRFSGWLGPSEDPWVTAVPAELTGPVAAQSRTLEPFAAVLAERLEAVVLSVSVHRDRLLRLLAWDGTREVARYISDPTYGLPPDDEVFPEPEGVEHAETLARLCDRPDAADELTELLGEMLDDESEIESERLAAVLRLLGLPSWVVAAAALPKNGPGGPPAADFTRLGAGRLGVAGRLAGSATRVGRRARRPRA